MLTYALDTGEKTALYEQIYRLMKEDIVAGRLVAEEKLPSKRNFAKNLGVSITTVENAYSQLLTEGYIYSLPQKGFFVAKIEVLEEKSPQIKETMGEKQGENQENLADFVRGGVSTEAFPFSTWLRLMRGVMSREAEGVLLTERPAGGLLALRLAIAHHLKDFRGMKVSPEQIIVGAGTEYLYTVLIQLLGRDKLYGVEEPGYRKISWIYEQNDISCEHLPIDEEGLMAEGIEDRAVDILHITPSHHFPTGVVMPVGRRYELLSWAGKAEGRYIIEDDYDCEFRLAGKPIPTLQSIDTLEKVVYINTFSQSLAPAFRMSYLVLPPHLSKRFYEDLGFYSGTVSCFEQLTLAKFIEEGYFEKHINRMRTHYRNNRDAFLEELKRQAKEGSYTIEEEDAGVHFIMVLRSPFTEEEILKRGAESGLALSFVSSYYHARIGEENHRLVLNYSGILPTKLPKIVRALTECVGILAE